MSAKKKKKKYGSLSPDLAFGRISPNPLTLSGFILGHLSFLRKLFTAVGQVLSAHLGLT
jgi:hypothetical protein